MGNPVTVSIDDMKQMLDTVYYGRKIDFKNNKKVG